MLKTPILTYLAKINESLPLSLTESRIIQYKPNMPNIHVIFSYKKNLLELKIHRISANGKIVVFSAKVCPWFSKKRIGFNFIHVLFF